MVRNAGGYVMAWYVIHTMTGKEDELLSYLNDRIPNDILNECFIPKRERNKKFARKWRIVTEILFPGYVFVKTSQPQDLFLCLKDIPMFTNLLGDSENYFIALSENETEFVTKIGNGRDDHTIKISMVDFSEGDTVEYLEGDLKCFEGQIKRFDKRRRQAVVETEMFGRTMELYLGFEFLRKRE